MGREGSVVSPLLSPLDQLSSVGLKSPDSFPGVAPLTPGLASPVLVMEKQLLINAPNSLAGVVTGSMDEEDQVANTDARVGYSGRTEKMHRFLAKEFTESRTKAISYEELCKTQAAGRRELIAGCFFELLVLKTNGVISLKQDDPKSDIKILKDKLWSK